MLVSKITLHSPAPWQSHSATLCGAGVWQSLSGLRCCGVTIPLWSAVRGPSLATLRCWCDPISICSALSVGFHPSLFGGAGARPSLSTLRCRCYPIPLQLYGIGTIPFLSGLRCWVHPSPLCGVSAIQSLSALRYRDDSIPLLSAVLGRDHPSLVYCIGTFPSLHRSAVLVRDHPSPVCGAGSIPLHSAVLGPSISTLRCRCDPIPLRSTVSGRFHPSTVRRC